MPYTNSPLVSFTKLSPNNSGTRTHAIDRITPHCVVGQSSVEALGDLFANPARQASCNYAIGADGRVGMYVPESNRSWCSSSRENDQRAITIECASDATYPYAFRSVVYSKLIDLCVDICWRNGKKKLLWLGEKSKTLEYVPADDEMILSVHRWFENKSCPGEWMYSRMSDLAEKVTAQLGGTNTPSNPIEDNIVLTECMIPGVVLKRGSRGGYVKALQTLLSAQGFAVGSIDGKFGPATLTAVKNFQLVRKLVVDGSVGPKTWAVLLKFE